MKQRMWIGRWVGNAAVLAVSLALSVLASEYLARIVLDPVDYLIPKLSSDEFLGHRIEAFTGGHDAWGFRNSATPESASIVCLGDSVTYGMSATSQESWPKALGQIRSAVVYNMGLGGYGPIQYLHLMRTLVPKLHPKIVIVGISLGTDLLDVYETARNNRNWMGYGNFEGGGPAASVFTVPGGPGRFLGGTRDWLRTHSLLYSAVTRLPVFDLVRGREASIANESGSLIVFRDEKHHQIFNLNDGFRFLNVDDPRIQTAIEVMKQVGADMRAAADKEGSRLLVVLVPTRERVYGDLLTDAGYADRYPQLKRELVNEDKVRTALSKLLADQNLDVMDLLPGLAAAVKERNLYPLTDPHPNNEGYRVIAELISRHLDMMRPGDKPH
jgi:hypothetical protein